MHDLANFEFFSVDFNVSVDRDKCLYLWIDRLLVGRYHLDALTQVISMKWSDYSILKARWIPHTFVRLIQHPNIFLSQDFPTKFALISLLTTFRLSHYTVFSDLLVQSCQLQWLFLIIQPKPLFFWWLVLLVKIWSGELFIFIMMIIAEDCYTLAKVLLIKSHN